MASHCTGSAFVFSGRPDPVWTITDRQRAALARLWAGLAPSRTGPPAAPVLGYKGVSVSCPSGERWFVWGGVARLTAADGVDEFRADSDRGFERAIVNTAPKGILPMMP